MKSTYSNYYDRSNKFYNKWQSILKTFGFECSHLMQYKNMEYDLTIDFSAIAEDKVLYYLIQCVYKKGIEDGRTKIQSELCDLLGVNQNV